MSRIALRRQHELGALVDDRQECAATGRSSSTTCRSSCSCQRPSRPRARRRRSASSREQGPWLAQPSEPPEVDDPGEATALDVRMFAQHAAGHIPGSSASRSRVARSGQKPGFVLTAGEPVVLHASTASRRSRGARSSGRSGCSSSPATSSAARNRDARDRRPGGAEGAARPPEVQVVDVREASSATGLPPRVDQHPLPLLRKIACGALERDRPVVTVCESGPRAAIAASLLQREGFDVRAVTGGGSPTSPATWSRSGAAARSAQLVELPHEPRRPHAAVERLGPRSATAQDPRRSLRAAGRVAALRSWLRSGRRSNRQSRSQPRSDPRRSHRLSAGRYRRANACREPRIEIRRQPAHLGEVVGSSCGTVRHSDVVDQWPAGVRTARLERHPGAERQDRANLLQIAAERRARDATAKSAAAAASSPRA